MSEQQRRWLILGAGGFLGSNLLMEASPRFVVIPHRRGPSAHGNTSANEVYGSLDAPEDVRSLLDSVRPDTVINCVALADVDGCEHEPARAEWLNAQLPGEIAGVTCAAGVRLIHISTDAVFGDTLLTCDESSTPTPINTYGATKLEGEQAVLEQDPSALVLRTNIVGFSPSGRRSLLEFFVDGLRCGTSRNAFADVFFRPVTPQQLWRLIFELVDRDVTGLVHTTGGELISKYEFARRVATGFELDERLLRRSSVIDAHLTARRAVRMDVAPSRLRSLGIEPPGIDQGLAELVELEQRGFRTDLANTL